MSIEERIARLEVLSEGQSALMAEVRKDVKTLLHFRAAWLAMTSLISAAVAWLFR